MRQHSLKHTISVIAAAAAVSGALYALPASADEATKAVPQNDLMNATVWMETSAEYKANVMELFKQAQWQLDKALADTAWTAVPDMEPDNYKTLPLAIVSDLDETLLDNGDYESSLITRGTSYSSKEWADYVASETSTAIPGATDFLKYAASKGVKIFYVSNRKEAGKEATTEVLKKLGYPLDDKVETVLLKGGKDDWGSDKGSRIQYVAKNYRVVLLMGDNLGDFTDKADGTMAERDAAVTEAADHWGKDWFMLPNPEYGSWESAAFGGDWSKSADERRQMKMDALKPWQPSK